MFYRNIRKTFPYIKTEHAKWQSKDAVYKMLWSCRNDGFEWKSDLKFSNKSMLQKTNVPIVYFLCISVFAVYDGIFENFFF